MLSAQNLHHYVNKFLDNYSACAVSVWVMSVLLEYFFSAASVTAEGRLNKKNKNKKCVKCVGEAIGNKQFFHSVPCL